MVKRRDVDDLRPPLVSGLTQRCLFIAALVVGLLIVIDQVFSKPINGICGSAEGVATSTALTSGLCSSGSATSVSGGGGSPWTWHRQGSALHQRFVWRPLPSRSGQWCLRPGQWCAQRHRADGRTVLGG
jgi:hypothetical protein